MLKKNRNRRRSAVGTVDRRDLHPACGVRDHALEDPDSPAGRRVRADRRLSPLATVVAVGGA